MRIQPIEAAKIDSFGQSVQSQTAFLEHTDQVFRGDFPEIKKATFLGNKPDGEKLPKIGWLGPDSLINSLMNGAWGDDYAATIRNSDPEYERLIAPAFVAAAAGHIVTDKVEAMATPAGFTKPIFVSYYRVIIVIKLPIGRNQVRNKLVCLTEPTEDLAQYIWRDRRYQLDG